MCLLIGAAGVGKTLLLKRLQNFNEKTENFSICPATIPTVGTNLVNVIVGKKQEVMLRELGGAMAPIWHNFYKDCNNVMFMIDLSNRLQVSESCLQLLAMMSNDVLASCNTLILLNKIDLPDIMTQGEFESLFRLNDAIKFGSQKVTVYETSSKTGQGLKEVVKWLHTNHRQK